MARVITEQDVRSGTLSKTEAHWVYNGLDCCVTREVYDVLRPRAPAGSPADFIYRFAMAQQSPALAMAERGVLVDKPALAKAIKLLETDLTAALTKLQDTVAPWWKGVDKDTGPCGENKLHKWPRGLEDTDPKRVCGRCGAPRLRRSFFNPLSHHDVAALFYKHMKMEEQYNKKGQVSTDKDCLDRLGLKNENAGRIVDGIKECRSMRKQLGVLRSGLSPDGRMRSSFNVGTPETGRWSSSANAFGDGTNLQNIADKLRFIFVADPGMELVYADIKQAESNIVAALAGDERYLEAHATGDVHTYAARLIWPDLPWTQDIKRDRKIAEGNKPTWDPDHDYRYNSKRIQHGSNYLLTPYGIARIARIRQFAAKAAQDAYFDAFSGIRWWQLDRAQTIRETGVLTTPLNRRRQFFGRTWDAHTIRQGVAFEPQSMVADILDAILWMVWLMMDPGGRPRPIPGAFWPLAQVHDAILGLRMKGDDAAIERLRELMTLPVRIGDRILTLGLDVAIGHNWGKFDPDKNPQGIK